MAGFRPTSIPPLPPPGLPCYRPDLHSYPMAFASQQPVNPYLNVMAHQFYNPLIQPYLSCYLRPVGPYFPPYPQPAFPHMHQVRRPLPIIPLSIHSTSHPAVRRTIRYTFMDPSPGEQVVVSDDKKAAHRLRNKNLNLCALFLNEEMDNKSRLIISVTDNEPMTKIDGKKNFYLKFGVVANRLIRPDLKSGDSNEAVIPVPFNGKKGKKRDIEFKLSESEKSVLALVKGKVAAVLNIPHSQPLTQTFLFLVLSGTACAVSILDDDYVVTPPATPDTPTKPTIELPAPDPLTKNQINFPSILKPADEETVVDRSDDNWTNRQVEKQERKREVKHSIGSEDAESASSFIRADLVSQLLQLCDDSDDESDGELMDQDLDYAVGDQYLFVMKKWATRWVSLSDDKRTASRTSNTGPRILYFNRPLELDRTLVLRIDESEESPHNDHSFNFMVKPTTGRKFVVSHRISRFAVVGSVVMFRLTRDSSITISVYSANGTRQSYLSLKEIPADKYTIRISLTGDAQSVSIASGDASLISSNPPVNGQNKQTMTKTPASKRVAHLLLDSSNGDGTAQQNGYQMTTSPFHRTLNPDVSPFTPKTMQSTARPTIDPKNNKNNKSSDQSDDTRSTYSTSSSTDSSVQERKWYSSSRIKYSKGTVTRTTHSDDGDYIFSSQFPVNDCLYIDLDLMDKTSATDCLMFGVTRKPLLSLDLSSLPADPHELKQRDEGWFVSENLCSLGVRGLRIERFSRHGFQITDTSGDSVIETMDITGATSRVYPFLFMAGKVKQVHVSTVPKVQPLSPTNKCRLKLLFSLMSVAQKGDSLSINN